ncbi:MAG: biotin--[acetyl-CoA-carboxylase] ligase [Bacteroidetes bacterium]|nr:biotin--[acetyl-CoA-carboxylase] ligase [Bacteroidota bacterium]
METLFIGTNLIFLPEVNSTNSYAIELLKNVNLPEGTVIHAANQTAGRGQRGNVWNTLPDSNLTASVVLNPVFLELKKQFFLYQIAALACYDVMAELLNSSQYDIKIKWPNDIMVNEKKIAGILIENIVMNSSISRSIIGIGINVRQGEFDGKINATSLQILTGKEFAVTNILSSICSALEKYYLLLKNGSTEIISEKYLSHFFGLNKWVDFEINNVIHSLLVKGISPKGLLLLGNKESQQTEYDVKEVKWLL